jgi:hypothetical protein
MIDGFDKIKLMQRGTVIADLMQSVANCPLLYGIINVLTSE